MWEGPGPLVPARSPHLLPLLQVFADPVNALGLQVFPVMFRDSLRLPLAPDDLSHRARRGPGAHVLVQRDVILAVVGEVLVPSDRAAVRPDIAARHPKEAGRFCPAPAVSTAHLAPPSAQPSPPPAPDSRAVIAQSPFFLLNWKRNPCES